MSQMRDKAEAMGRVANAREGSVLIVALGVLTLLSIIGSIFATMMRFESVAASNYVIEMKAKLLAESGVAKATRAIQQVASESAYTSTVKVDLKNNASGAATPDGIPDSGAWLYFGEDIDEDGVLDTGETSMATACWTR
jgi:Tfp pilus assembly protein PilX